MFLYPVKCLLSTQLTRDDPEVKGLNTAALGLAVYGGLVCIFW